MPFKKTLRKAYKAGKKGLKARYGLNKKSKGLNYGQMASDVLMLKKMVNAEKKYHNYTAGQVYGLGQVNGATLSGALCYDITPLITQGNGPDGRNGTSVKLCSGLYQFQITQQSATYFDAKVVIDFWINKGQPITTADAQTQLFDTSQFSGVIDTNSPRNINRFADFQRIRSVTRTIKQDQVNIADLQTITFDVPLNFNRGKGHHIRLVNSISGTPVNDILNGQMFMTMRCSAGNTNASTTSTRDVPYTAINTGQNVRFAYKTWFYDN